MKRKEERKKNPHAAAMGRRSMVTMTPEARARRARRAALARWHKKPSPPAKAGFQVKRTFTAEPETELKALDRLLHAPAFERLVNAPEGGRS